MPRSTPGEVPKRKILAAATGENPPPTVRQIVRTSVPRSPLDRLFKKPTRSNKAAPAAEQNEAAPPHEQNEAAPPHEQNEAAPKE